MHIIMAQKNPYDNQTSIHHTALTFSREFQMFFIPPEPLTPKKKKVRHSTMVQFKSNATNLYVVCKYNTIDT
jgi:hypothetical protein